ncbi:hypothetical protein SBA4_5740013 [Candidatus Sulfopaludibacter sp. SbA4]|nr:hypothetical protein SBA4_5740013 [Candidatus Sulfopaludibacter sp. SbA4]
MLFWSNFPPLLTRQVCYRLGFSHFEISGLSSTALCEKHWVIAILQGYYVKTANRPHY